VKIGNRREARGVRKTMKEKSLLALCVMLFALCVSVEAQQAKKVPWIIYLLPVDPAGEFTLA
jgi:hypothetical protein